MAGIEAFSKEELEEITKAQAKNNKLREGLYMTLEDLRFATNQKVAEYRAKSLACNLIVEIGCSIGSQTIEFAKTCKKVIAVDVDERKIRYAKANLEKLGIKNVELICADGLSLDIKKADIIFCDPERDPSAKERNLSSFKPDIYELVKKYSNVTKNFCIEIPPQTREINLECEKEYISVDGELNRLNLYLGKLKTAESSVVLLPGETKINGTPADNLARTKSKKYLYEINEAVIRAGLVDALAALLDEEVSYFKDDCRFLTSENKTSSPFFKNSFKVVTSTDNEKEAIEKLREKKFGKVILRQNVKPEDYWKTRKKYEGGLRGNKTAHLMISKNVYIICEKISSLDQEIS